MRRGFKRTDYRIERKNKFVNLENFLLCMVMKSGFWFAAKSPHPKNSI